MTEIWVMIARYYDGSDEPTVLAAFTNIEAAKRWLEVVRASDPAKKVTIHPVRLDATA